MGERIFDKNIAERLGVSRSIVRQVLTILTKEELLVMIPRKGFYIREIPKKEIEEIYNVRQVLESYATELAVPRINDIDINRLEKLFKKAESDLKYYKVKSFIETDIALHLLVINNCGNEHLKKIINKRNKL